MDYSFVQPVTPKQNNRKCFSFHKRF